MKNNFTFRTISISLILLVLFVSFTGCCKECCSPSIEVGMIKPNAGALSHYQPNKIQMWTWEPRTKFPQNPNKQITGSQLESSRPYLSKAEVTNYSDVDVNGVTVAFYWASFGLFDKGTPIGAVAVDLPANSSKWVSSPWTFTLGEKNIYSLCLTTRVFHPCDTQLENNYCYRNFAIVVLPWPWKIYAYPFTVDFSEHGGRMALQIEAPDGIRASVREQIGEGAVDSLGGTKAVKEFDVKRGVPQNLSLVIENVGADFKRGDTFDVTLRGMQNDREVSSFTVRFQVGAER